MKVFEGNDFGNLVNLVECFIMKLSYELIRLVFAVEMESICEF